MLEKGEIDEAGSAEKTKSKFPKTMIPMEDILGMWKPWIWLSTIRVWTRAWTH